MSGVEIGFAGDWDGALANELRAELNLVRATDGVIPGGLLIDTAAGGLDGVLAQRYLASGSPVGLIAPTAQALQQVQALTGCAPVGPVPFLTLRRRSNGAYDISEVATTRPVTGGGVGDEHGHAAVEEQRTASPAAAGAVSASRIAAAFAPVFVGATAGGLQSPLGTYGGNVHLTKSWQYDLDHPTFNNKPDDRAAQGRNQTVFGSANIDVYAYWVNGLSNTAYYVLLVRLSGTLANGNLVATGKNNQGFFHVNTTAASAIYSSTTNQRLIPSAHSPATSDPGQIVTSLQFPMVLWGLVPGGVGPIDFSATYANLGNWQSWALIDRSAAQYASWFGYQKAVWDVMQYPPENYTDAYRDMLFRDGKVIPMPDQSKGSITFDTIAAWMIEAPAFTMPAKPQRSAPPSCPITVSCQVYRQFALFHSPDGCLGARGNHQYNMFWQSGGVAPEYSIDLQNIATRVG